MNLNFPACDAERVEGVVLARQGRREQELMKIEARHDGRGNPYYWIAFERPRFKAAAGTDLEAVARNRISVTPLRLDLTDDPALVHFADLFS
ncbi:MAG TPA: 5'/3'-nucleotidase SurE, partial [Rhodoblastus sp.]|nr:5'/3'-nucleotidase SurE [Rhodoblastus sp.]